MAKLSYVHTAGYSMNYKVVSPSKVVGEKLEWAYSLDRGWTRCPLRVTVPDRTKLFNFEVKLPDGKMLILDNYGDETLPDRLRRPILNTKRFKETIGILSKTGEIFRVGFIAEHIPRAGCPEEGTPDEIEIKYSMTFWAFDNSPTVPAKYLKRISELKGKKRPFYLTLHEGPLYGFITRWQSYADLQSSLVVDLDFNEERLQVWGDNYRTVSAWT